jgi:hypothetical protein
MPDATYDAALLPIAPSSHTAPPLIINTRERWVAPTVSHHAAHFRARRKACTVQGRRRCVLMRRFGYDLVHDRRASRYSAASCINC